MKCLYCGSEKVVKNGHRVCDRIHRVQCYRCNNCNKQFVENKNPLGNKKHSDETKYIALKFHHEGLSYKCLATVLGINSTSLILYWDMRDKELAKPMKKDDKKLQQLVAELRETCQKKLQETYKNMRYYKQFLKVLDKVFP